VKTASPRRTRRTKSRVRQTRDLSRQKIIEVALRLLDREGPDAVSMRRVASVLRVTPMALYNHFSHKKALLRGIAEYALQQAAFDGPEGDWREQIRHCFRAFRGVCLQHPNVPRILEMAGVAPAIVFAPMEVTLRALRTAGLSDQNALRAYFTLVAVTLSLASYEANGPVPDLEPVEQVRSRRIAGHGYSALEQLNVQGDWDYEAAFEYSLSLIIQGIEVEATGTGRKK
jgi:TetR/AcrR family transcriptional regulator, tetracycline repressor protein